jgi:hypothetical protein
MVTPAAATAHQRKTAETAEVAGILPAPPQPLRFSFARARALKNPGRPSHDAFRPPTVAAMPAAARMPPPMK